MGGCGAGVSEYFYFTMNPNLIFFFVCGGGGCEARISEFFVYKDPNLKKGGGDA